MQPLAGAGTTAGKAPTATAAPSSAPTPDLAGVTQRGGAGGAYQLFPLLDAEGSLMDSLPTHTAHTLRRNSVMPVHAAKQPPDHWHRVIALASSPPAIRQLPASYCRLTPGGELPVVHSRRGCIELGRR